MKYGPKVPFECSVLLPVLEIAALFAIIRFFYRKSISKQIYLAVTFQAVFEMFDVLRTYGELFIKRLTWMVDRLNKNLKPM